jgi:hypothetical protein
MLCTTGFRNKFHQVLNAKIFESQILESKKTKGLNMIAKMGKIMQK